ncbi:Ppx/GppA phosphatase [Aneurinibacillus soli]|uniref:Exopolyphosphatase n=2 Tax=Aneurinibacillus soli TaxID=1500254 RepID=A0A0U5C565_9BACL|nr:Ppx/GppA phosphatase [Aneurinibacillus soli]BAU26963.1 Exopolyphosphatase [Aneurinibacillus soli]
MHMGSYNAVIDMGSNSVRIVMYYEEEDGAFYEIDNMKQTIRLSSYVDAEQCITEQGIREVLAVLRQFRQLCSARAVSRVIGVATATVRRAKNRTEFLTRIYQETGFRFRVLSGEEEAYYGYLAVANTTPVTNAFTIDIGGASTEIVNVKDRKLINSYSFPFGAVTLTREFFRGSIPGKVEMKEMIEYVRAELVRHDWLMNSSHPLVGMGGTARNLSKIHQMMIRYPFPSLHYYPMRKYEVDSVFHLLLDQAPERMQSVQGLSKERADIILAGVLLIKTVMEHIGTTEFVTSNKGLRDGVHLESYLKRVQKPLLEDVVQHGVNVFMNNYKVNRTHARHVRELALSLFEGVKKLELHSYGAPESKLLDVAAQLYDIGRSINLRESHRHTFYLMIHVLLPGLTHRERILAALIASYKGTKRLQELAAPYESLLSEADMQMADTLGVLLTMARALDRTESGQVKAVRVQRIRDEIVLLCEGGSRPELELQAIEEYRKKFRKQFRLPLVIRWVEYS